MAESDDEDPAQRQKTGTRVVVVGASVLTMNGESSDNTLPEAPPRGKADERQEDTMETWYTEARRSRAGNQIAATRYQDLGRGLGAASAALTAFVGGSLFTSWSANETNAAVQITTGTISVAAAVLVVVITFLGFSAKSVQHQQASVKFGEIVHDLEALHAADHTEDEWTTELEQVKKALNDAASDSPILPRRFFNKGQRWVYEHHRTLAGAPLRRA